MSLFSKLKSWRVGFVCGMAIGAIGVLFWRWSVGDFRHHYVAARDMELLASPNISMGVIPRGSEISTILPIGFEKEDFGSEAWIRVRIHISDAKNLGLATFEDAHFDKPGIPLLSLEPKTQ
jgi:hypothetical protein